MSKKPIKENNFEPGVGGLAGISNVQPGYGTFASPDVTQNPAHFQSGKSVDNNSNTVKSAPHPEEIEKGLDAIYAKQGPPEPDDFVAGMKYEMGQQIKKNKEEAKREVIKHLKQDPRYYRDLKQLNVDDKSMVANMAENKHPNDSPARPMVKGNVEETKKIFAEMAKGRDNKYVVNSQIVDVMKEMWIAKKQRSAWRNG